MRRIAIAMMMIAVTSLMFLVLSGCRSESHHQSSVGYLKIINNTNAPITITWTSDNTHNTVDANAFRIFEFDMDNKVTSPSVISTTYTTSGLYLHEVTRTDDIYVNETTTHTFEPDRGCIKFINNTEGPVYLAINGLLNPITIPEHADYVQAWRFDGSTGPVSFTKSGDFVFTSDGQANVYLNATGTYPIDATGAAILVRNYSTSPISEVYISPHSEANWGDNDLMGTISPGHYIVWTVTPNTWDVKVANNDGYYSTWTNNDYIDLNQYLTIDFDPSKAPNKHAGDKPMGSGSAHVGANRIQQVR